MQVQGIVICYVFIYVYWCQTRFPYQTMFVSFNSNSFIHLADMCDRPFYNLQFVLCVSDICAHVTPRGLLFLNFRDSRSDTFDTNLVVEQD